MRLVRRRRKKKKSKEQGGKPAGATRDPDKRKQRGHGVQEGMCSISISLIRAVEAPASFPCVNTRINP